MQRVPAGKQRCCLTHVAFICDRSDLQQLLPQVIIGNERTFTAEGFAALQALCPANVILVRQKSAWNNGVLCGTIIKWLGDALRPHIDAVQPVLLLDAVRLHWAPAVLTACRASGVWPVLVPAKTTWLLQPLDTHAFQPYKAHLREAYQKARAAHQSADLPIEQFLPCVYETIQNILEGKKWAAAFNKDGFGNSQTQIRNFVKEELSIDAPVHLPTSRPASEQLQACFPRKAHVPEAAIWQTLQPPTPKAKAKAAASVSATALAVPKHSGILARTRLQHRLALAAAAKAKAGSSASSSADGGPVVARGMPFPGRPRGR